MGGGWCSGDEDWRGVMSWFEPYLGREMGGGWEEGCVGAVRSSRGLV